MDNKILDINDFEVSTPTLMSIPPKPSELDARQKYYLRLQELGKKEIVVCCDKTKHVVIKLLERKITENDLNIILEALKQHPYDRFGGNKYFNKNENSLNIDALIDEVFEISALLSHNEISKLFLSEFYELVQIENKNPNWAITLTRFNKKWEIKSSKWDF